MLGAVSSLSILAGAAVAFAIKRNKFVAFRHRNLHTLLREMALASVKGTISFGAPFGSIIESVASVALINIEIAVGPVLLTILGRVQMKVHVGAFKQDLRDGEIFANLRLKL